MTTVRPSPRLLRLATAGLLVSLAGLWWPSLVAIGGAGMVLLLLVELRGLGAQLPAALVHAPSRVSVGQECEVTVGLMPRGRTWFRVTLRLETHGGLQAGPDVFEARIPRGGSRRIAMTLVARHRGPAEIRAVWVRRTGPLGLLESVRRVVVDRSLRVSPNLGAVRQLAAVVNATGAHAGSVPVVTAGAGSEFDELRPYVRGMDSRSIDWKASARHRELHIRRYRQEQNQQLVVMLDNQAFEGMDHAVHSGLALARRALAQGDRVGLQVFGTQPRAWVPFGHGARHLQRLVTALGDVPPEIAPSNPVQGAHDLCARLRRRSMVVLFTHLCDPVRAELVAEAARLLQAKHRVIVAALRDPGQDAIPRPDTLEDVAQALLRRNLEAERTRAVQHVRAAGLPVIAAGRRGVLAGLMQRYRNGKRRVG